MPKITPSNLISRLRERKRSRELARIAGLPRRTPGETKCITLSGRSICFADGQSFEEQYWQIFHRRVYDIQSDSPRPLMIDGGANIGLAALRFLQQHPAGHVHAFEPDPTIFTFLEANTRHLSPERITLHNSALWESQGAIDFTSEGSDSGSIKPKQGFFTITVPSERLSKYLDRPIDFLKLDIEGSEIPVLLEAEAHLPFVSHLFVEHHSFEGGNQDLPELLAILERSGFRYKLESPEIKYPSFFKPKSYLGMDAFYNIYAFRF